MHIIVRAVAVAGQQAVGQADDTAVDPQRARPVVAGGGVAADGGMGDGQEDFRLDPIRGLVVDGGGIVEGLGALGGRQQAVAGQGDVGQGHVGGIDHPGAIAGVRVAQHGVADDGGAGGLQRAVPAINQPAAIPQGLVLLHGAVEQGQAAVGVEQPARLALPGGVAEHQGVGQQAVIDDVEQRPGIVVRAVVLQARGAHGQVIVELALAFDVGSAVVDGAAAVAGGVVGQGRARQAGAPVQVQCAAHAALGLVSAQAAVGDLQVGVGRDERRVQGVALGDIVSDGAAAVAGGVGVELRARQAGGDGPQRQPTAGIGVVQLQAGILHLQAGGLGRRHALGADLCERLPGKQAAALVEGQVIDQPAVADRQVAGGVDRPAVVGHVARQADLLQGQLAQVVDRPAIGGQRGRLA